MKSVIAILVLATAVFAKVIDLTPENFDKVVDGSQGVFVEFFAPWYKLNGNFLITKGVVTAKNWPP